MKESGKSQSGEARPPVVAILGHIDHGKSTLLDYIRKTNTTGKEAGGITQHISAYEVVRSTEKGDKRITFLDTPGHAAFSGTRERGAGAADIAALIVSAEDGVKPQTLEALKEIQERSLPFLVVITKIDKPSADVNRVKQSLAENNIYVEGFGGDTAVVELSAKTGEGVDDFLDMIGLMAELEGKTAEREALGSGVIIESRRDPKRGVTATGIIKNGTVRRGLFAAASGAVAPLRFFLDTDGNMVEELSFSSPIQIVGWDEIPAIGAEFRTFLKKDEAETFAAAGKSKTAENKSAKTAEGVSTLPLIIKADTAGSLEAIATEIGKLGRERIVPKIIASGVGSINENDIKSALATPGTMVFGFHAKTDSQAAALAERSGISISAFTIIYELTDKVAELLAEKEPRIEVEETTGSAKVLKIFSVAKNKQVLGARVTNGVVEIDTQVRILRRETEIGRGRVRELQQSKAKTSSVDEGNEFGAMVESKVEIAPGDIIEVVKMVTK